jgi:hypothetical protein
MSKIEELITENNPIKRDNYSEEDTYYSEWLTEKMSQNYITEKEWLERLRYVKYY